MNLLIDDPTDDAALTVLIDAVNGARSNLAVHVGCAQAYLEGRTLHDVCDQCFAELDFIPADDYYRRVVDQ